MISSPNTPLPPTSCEGGKGYCTALSRNKKEPGAFSLYRDLPGGGVYDCTTYGAWGQTSWFLPVNSLFRPNKTSKTAASDGSHCLQFYRGGRGYHSDITVICVSEQCMLLILSLMLVFVLKLLLLEACCCRLFKSALAF